MPDDPTIKPGFDLHRWLLWREQPKRGGPFSDPQDAISELYDFGLEGITEFTGAAQPPGLLDMGAHVLVPETIERGRLELIRVEERHGAQLQQRYDVVLRARFPSLLPGPLTIAAPGLWQYGNLTFRLAKPAEFGKYIANPQFRPRRVISHNALVAILLEDEVFQI